MNDNNKPLWVLSIYKLIGKGYENGWWTNCHCRYRVFKGGRNTKKSMDILGYEILDKILSDDRRNVLILRETSTSNKTSTFNTIVSLINQPDMNNPLISLRDLFKINLSTMTITRLATGQVIIFGGMQDPERLQGIRVVHGHLTDVYVEEAFELKSYDNWRKVDGSIRGDLPDGLFFQITFLMNAWNVGHWIYDVFFKTQVRKDINGNEVITGLEDDLNYLETHDYMDFKNEDVILEFGKGLYLHTSTFRINEFRDKEIYDVSMQELKEKAPEIYKVEALGMWGNTTDNTYPEFSDDLIKPRAFANNLRYSCFSIGIDTGLSNGEGKIKTGEDVEIKSATTMQLVGLTNDYSKLVCIDEYFYSNETKMIKKTEPEFIQEIVSKIIEWKEFYKTHPDLMKGVILVYVDCADIGFRQGLEIEAKRQGLYNVKFLPSTKIRIQTRVDFIRYIMGYGDIYFSEACKNLIREIKVCHKGLKGEVREDINDHSINANEYAWQPIINRMRRWGNFKQH